jgi:streptomycin 6-kinase
MAPPTLTKDLHIADALRAACAPSPAWSAWLEALPATVSALLSRWSLTIERIPAHDGQCSWIALVRCADGSPAVLKLGLPHDESRDEIEGLRFWAGDPTVVLLAFDHAHGAMLLERCEPGTALRTRPEHEQDLVIAPLLRRMWRTPPRPHPFRHLSAMTARWADEATSDQAAGAERRLLDEAVQLFADLSTPRADDVLLATDLHAGNVLQADRLPWLVIDPKPFVGDPCYDATQHLLNCKERLRWDAVATMTRVADLLDVDRERVRAWMFARAAIESWGDAVTRTLHAALRGR